MATCFVLCSFPLPRLTAVAKGGFILCFPRFTRKFCVLFAESAVCTLFLRRKFCVYLLNQQYAWMDVQSISAVGNLWFVHPIGVH